MSILYSKIENSKFPINDWSYINKEDLKDVIGYISRYITSLVPLGRYGGYERM